VNVLNRIPPSFGRNLNKMNRRFFLFNLFFLIELFFYSIYKFLTYPVFKSFKIVKISLDNLKEGVNEFPENSIIVLKKGKDFKVLSSICTHLGCTVKFISKNNYFQCPCHRSIFSINGDVIKGPAKKPLKELKFTIRRGFLIIKA